MPPPFAGVCVLIPNPRDSRQVRFPCRFSTIPTLKYHRRQQKKEYRFLVLFIPLLLLFFIPLRATLEQHTRTSGFWPDGQ
jgi:hypothetical protein